MEKSLSNIWGTYIFEETYYSSMYAIGREDTKRVRCWIAKLLSYVGIIQLIKSVIFGVQTYWAQIFVLPERIN